MKALELIEEWRERAEKLEYSIRQDNSYTKKTTYAAVTMLRLCADELERCLNETENIKKDIHETNFPYSGKVTKGG